MANKTPTVYTNARLKEYPTKYVMQVANKAIFPYAPGAALPRPYAVPPPGEAKDPEKAKEESQRRAKARVRDIALCNCFEYFFTFTISPHLLNRYDPKTIYQKVRNFLANAVKRKGFAYVLVPEYHKLKKGETSPGIHMHGLCKLGKVRIERATSKKGLPLFDRHNRPIYNMLDWKWGFSTCVPIDQQYERTVNYITKYITKNTSKIFGKWYLASRNVIKFPTTIPLDPVLYDEHRDIEKISQHIQIENEICKGLKLITEEYPVINNTN